MKYSNPEIASLANKKLSAEELLKAFDEILSSERAKNTELKTEHERLSVIIDLIPNTISWVNRDMTYFGVNKALADTCGVTPQDFVGKTIGFHTKERFFYEFVTDLFRSPSNTIYRELEARISGTDRTYLVSGTKLNDKDKAVVIGVDITELTALKGHVSFTEKLATLGEMFAGIIHDINNPLMMIEANAKRIKKRVEDEEVHELLTKIDMSSKKIGKIVHGIKVFIRQDGEAPFTNENLGTIIDDSLTICEHKLKESKVAVHLDQKLNQIQIPCNFTQIFQVFVNLLSNSIDALEKAQEKWIEITVKESNKDQVVISFKDGGTGIPADLQAKIFNAFFTTKDRGVGSGLGLSLCKKILEAHGGSLQIDNTNKNTCFLITFKKA